MSAISIAGADTLLKWSIQAKEYLKGDPCSLRVYNFNADYLTLDSYVLDSKQKAEEAVLPDLVIPKNNFSTTAFKANLFFKSSTQYLFRTRYEGNSYTIHQG